MADMGNTSRSGQPKQWDLFISHTQRNAEAKLLALDLFNTLERMGYSCWLDVKVIPNQMNAPRPPQ